MNPSYLLTQEEELELAHQIVGEGPTAGFASTELVKANLPLVAHAARRYTNRGVHKDDLIQEGNIGLMKAAEKFDTRGSRFADFARWKIKHAIIRALGNQARIVRLPIGKVDKLKEVWKVETELIRKRGEAPSSTDIAIGMGLDTKAVRDLVELNCVSVPIADVGDTIEDENVEGPDAALLKQELVEAIRLEIHAPYLTPREQAVLELRYGLKDGVEAILDDVAKEVGLSPEGARKAQFRALRKLRENSPNLRELFLQ